MKALVLCGGKGTRLRPITYSFAKQLIPVANKPILYYILEDIADTGIKEAGIVVGDTEELIKEAIGSGERWGLKVTYIRQERPLGLAHAVKISQGFIGKEPFVMYLGDNLLKGGIKSFVNEYGNNGEDINVFLTTVEHPNKFGVARLDDKNKIIELIEKPEKHVSNKALIGVYIFNTKIFTAVNSIEPSWRNELEITDAIQYLIDRGANVKPIVIDGWWKDTGKKEDVLEANRLMLEGLSSNNQGKIDQRSNISGRIQLGKNSVVKGSLIRGPVIVGDNVIIKDSYIGPFTSIGNRVELINSKIEDSIVMKGTVINSYKKLITNSLIGRDVHINNRQERPEACELLLGDKSRLMVSE